MKLTFVNVGYGEAMVLECPDESRPDGRFVMVIDGGSGEADEYADRSSGRWTLLEYLDSSKVGHIDCMVNTHIHEDHTCGLLPAAERYAPAELWQTLPVDFFRRSMHILDDRQARPASEGKFMRALNDYQRLCELVLEHGGTVRCALSWEMEYFPQNIFESTKRDPGPCGPGILSSGRQTFAGVCRSKTEILPNIFWGTILFQQKEST